MRICMVGVNHTVADAELRGRFSFRKTELRSRLTELLAYPAISGAVIVSTCNRTEVYASSPDPATAVQSIKEFILDTRDVTREEATRCLTSRTDAEAVEHLFSVVCSLDSMVLGEQQIIGQTRTAFIEAGHSGSTTAILTRLFRQAIECGKRVRNQTGISQSHVSMSTVAIDIARRAFDDFSDKTVLVVGAGEAGELAARYLKEQGVTAFIVSSRTREHALALAEELGGTARKLDELPQLVAQADIIVSGTSAPHYVITPEVLAPRAANPDAGEKLLILDIAIPRDVDPACRNVAGVTVRDLDDIGAEIARNQDARSEAAEHARAIVAEETSRFMEWSASYAATPLIKEVRLQAEAIRQGEVAHLLRTLDADLSEKDLERLEAATSAIVKKILHKPTVRLRDSATQREGFETIDAARYLFDVRQDS